MLEQHDAVANVRFQKDGSIKIGQTAGNMDLFDFHNLIACPFLRPPCHLKDLCDDHVDWR